MEGITHLAKSLEQVFLSHQASDSHTTADQDTHCALRYLRMGCMHCTDCSHSAARALSILMVHRQEMIDSLGYRSSGGHTEAEIGHIVGWDTLPARRHHPIEATLDSVVVSRMSYCGRSQVCCRSHLHLVAGVRLVYPP